MSVQTIQRHSAQDEDSLVYPWIVVAILMLAYVASFIDRQILSLLIEPIRADLQISDTQFGLLQGIAFSLFYAALGMPIARLSDKHSRPLIIAVGVLVWSLATAACGLARSFFQLLLARICVGAGEATLSPAAYSMLGDYFPPHKLGLALAVYSTGSFVGAGLAFLLGGAAIDAVTAWGPVTLPVLGNLAPWQLVFILVGLPGVLIAWLILALVRDPQRKEIGTSSSDGAGRSGVMSFLLSHRSVFLCHFLGYSMTAMALFGLMGWSPAYLIRTFDLRASQAGYLLGPMMMIGCTAGVLFSGWLMDRQRSRGQVDAPMSMGVIGAIGTAISMILLPFASSLWAAALILTVTLFFASFPLPPSTAAIQLLSPNKYRAQISAILLFFNSFVGLALGSFLIGFLNDYAFGSPKAVGLSLTIIVCVSSIIGAGLLFLGRGPFRTMVTTATP